MTKFFQADVLQKPKKKFSKFRKISIPIFVGICLFGALFVYLFQVNTIAAQGFAVRDMEKEIQTLTYDNEKLELQLIEMQSMGDLSQRVEELNMVAVDKIVYYDTAGAVVARR